MNFQQELVGNKVLFSSQLCHVVWFIPTTQALRRDVVALGVTEQLWAGFGALDQQAVMFAVVQMSFSLSRSSLIRSSSKLMAASYPFTMPVR